MLFPIEGWRLSICSTCRGHYVEHNWERLCRFQTAIKDLLSSLKHLKAYVKHRDIHRDEKHFRGGLGGDFCFRKEILLINPKIVINLNHFMQTQMKEMDFSHQCPLPKYSMWLLFVK